MHSVTTLRGTANLYYRLEREMGIANTRCRPGGRTQGTANGGPRAGEPG